jgi:V/A-type H+-transporting ATPase subunit K
MENTGIFSTLSTNEVGILLTALGVFFAAILAGIGSMIGVGRAGQAAAGVVTDQPERFGNCLVLQLLPGSQGIYGFAVAILILIFSGILGGDPTAITLQKGISYMIAGLPVGVGGLISAIHQGNVSVSGIQMLAKRADGFGNGMMFALMVETYALLSLIVSVFLVLFA